jgi:hypothetical protein
MFGSPSAPASWRRHGSGDAAVGRAADPVGALGAARLGGRTGPDIRRSRLRTARRCDCRAAAAVRSLASARGPPLVVLGASVVSDHRRGPLLCQIRAAAPDVCRQSPPGASSKRVRACGWSRTEASGRLDRHRCRRRFGSDASGAVGPSKRGGAEATARCSSWCVRRVDNGVRRSL